jgi:16S rRNA processing protein RimM
VPALWACGRLGRAHGLKGELYLDLEPGGLEVLVRAAEFYVAEAGGAGGVTPCRLTRAGGTDRRPLVVLDLAATREEARALSGRELYGAGGELAEVPHYLVGELVGLEVRYEGRRLGEIAAVVTAPAQEVLVVRRDGGGELMVPLVDELVAVDVAAGTAVVRAGLLADDVPPVDEAPLGDEAPPVDEAPRADEAAPSGAAPDPRRADLTEE